MVSENGPQCQVTGGQLFSLCDVKDKIKKTKANTKRVYGEDIVRHGRPRDRTPHANNPPGYDETFTPIRVCSVSLRTPVFPLFYITVLRP